MGENVWHMKRGEGRNWREKKEGWRGGELKEGELRERGHMTQMKRGKWQRLARDSGRMGSRWEEVS